ncbi:MAG: nitrous oxide-stimulated promoter family protein [Bacteroidales bacterium]
MRNNVIKREKKTIEIMMDIYCKSQHQKGCDCPGCEELLEYALDRLDRCPFGDRKSSCKTCEIHCYKPEMRKRIREVMRYAGPRMIFSHPLIAIRHLIQENRKPTPLP